MNPTFPPKLAIHLAESVRSARRRYRKRLARCQEKFSEKAVHDLRIDTRRILSLCLAAVRNAPEQETRFGLFRM